MYLVPIVASRCDGQVREIWGEALSTTFKGQFQVWYNSNSFILIRNNGREVFAASMHVWSPTIADGAKPKEVTANPSPPSILPSAPPSRLFCRNTASGQLKPFSYCTHIFLRRLVWLQLWPAAFQPEKLRISLFRLHHVLGKTLRTRRRRFVNQHLHRKFAIVSDCPFHPRKLAISLLSAPVLAGFVWSCFLPRCFPFYLAEFFLSRRMDSSAVSSGCSSIAIAMGIPRSRKKRNGLDKALDDWLADYERSLKRIHSDSGSSNTQTTATNQPATAGTTGSTGGLFGNMGGSTSQTKPGGGLFGNTAAGNTQQGQQGGSLFSGLGSNAGAQQSGTTTSQPQSTGLFGGLGGATAGNTAQQQSGTTGGGLFGNLGTSSTTQNQPKSLFGGLGSSTGGTGLL
jgi:hypothetical protein